MSWNGSSVKPSTHNGRGMRPSTGLSGVGRILFVVLLTLAGLGVMFWFILPRETGSVGSGNDRRQGLIPEATPAPAKSEFGDAIDSDNSNSGASKGSPAQLPSNDVGRIVTNAFGKAFRIDAVVVPRGPRLNGVEVYRDRRLFASNAENALDGIVNQAMGDRFLGDFDEKAFEREFLDSIDNKIEITDEDNEDEVRRKLQMIDIKKELFAAHENGESVGEIVKGMRDAVNQSADLRDNLIADLVTLKKSDATPSEIEDFYAAANKILEQHGIKPLYSPATIRQKLQEAKVRISEKRSQDK